MAKTSKIRKSIYLEKKKFEEIDKKAKKLDMPFAAYIKMKLFGGDKK